MVLCCSSLNWLRHRARVGTSTVALAARRASARANFKAPGPFQLECWGRNELCRGALLHYGPNAKTVFWVLISEMQTSQYKCPFCRLFCERKTMAIIMEIWAEWTEHRLWEWNWADFYLFPLTLEKSLNLYLSFVVSKTEIKENDVHQ